MFEFLQKDNPTPRKKYLVYPPADVVKFFLYVLVMIGAYIFCIAIGFAFLWGIFTLPLIIVFCFSCFLYEQHPSMI